MRIIVDFSRGLNFYPDLTLLDTLPPAYEESLEAMTEVLEKMTRLGARDAVISLHRNAENHVSAERADDRFLAGVRELCNHAAQREVMLHIQHHPHKWHGRADAMLAFAAGGRDVPRPLRGRDGGPQGLATARAGNLRFALNTSHVAMLGEDLGQALAAAGDRLGLVLISAPRRDLFGQVYDAHAPVSQAGLELAALQAYPDVPQVLDAYYASQDEEYADCCEVWGSR